MYLVRVIWLWGSFVMICCDWLVFFVMIRIFVFFLMYVMVCLVVVACRLFFVVVICSSWVVGWEKLVCLVFFLVVVWVDQLSCRIVWISFFVVLWFLFVRMEVRSLVSSWRLLFSSVYLVR